MSTKDWVFHTEPEGVSIGCYQDVTFDKVNNNPAVLEVLHPEEFKIVREKDYEEVSLSIPAEVFDNIAKAWCKKRKLSI